jgi:hypothetical protein
VAASIGGLFSLSRTYNLAAQDSRRARTDRRSERGKDEARVRQPTLDLTGDSGVAGSAASAGQATVWLPARSAVQPDAYRADRR